MDYKYTNFGQLVMVVNPTGELAKGVITAFDESNKLNTKVTYENGGFDWFNRDELEKDLISENSA